MNKFALSKQPADYQLSLHLNNLVIFYGKDKIDALIKNEAGAEYVLVANICNLRVHFGIAKVRKMWQIMYPAGRTNAA